MCFLFLLYFNFVALISMFFSIKEFSHVIGPKSRFCVVSAIFQSFRSSQLILLKYFYFVLSLLLFFCIFDGISVSSFLLSFGFIFFSSFCIWLFFKAKRCYQLQIQRICFSELMHGSMAA